jgi:dTDP-4-dehydrorhamnose reductase
MEKKKILLFGAQGMLGADIFFRISQLAEYEIIPLSRFNVDVRDEEKLRDIIDDYSPDIVINTTAFTNVDKCENKKRYF